MRRIRLCAAAALLSLAAVVSPAAVAVAYASDTWVNMWSGAHRIQPPVREICPSARDLRPGGAEYKVKDNGINIRSAPGGPVKWSIAKGTFFIADWDIKGSSQVYRCIAQKSGKQWFLGISTGKGQHYGWVRMDYLVFVKYLRS